VLSRLSLLFRSLSSWPASYTAILLSIVTQALASLVKAAFFFVPQTTTREPDQHSVVEAEEASENTVTSDIQEKQPVQTSLEDTVSVEDNICSMVTSVKKDRTEPILSAPVSRVPLSMVPRSSCTSSIPLAASSSVHGSPSSTVSIISPRTDPSSIVDLYCDDEFKLSLEYQPHMVLCPVDGLTSMEGELCRLDEGSILSMSLASTCSSLASDDTVELSPRLSLHRER